MSKVLTAKAICEEALGAIGAFPPTESAADPEHLRRAMTWLDMIMAEIAGTTRLFSLIPATIPLALAPSQASYNLIEELGADLPLDRIQFPVNAWLEDAAGNRTPLEIVTRDKFDAVSNAAETGPPKIIHIDRLAAAPTLRTHPIVGTLGFTLKLDVQTYAPNVAPSGVTGTQPSGSILTGFRQAWQLLLVNRLAKHLGSGPIIKLPKASLDEFRADADRAFAALTAFENREHETSDPVCEPWGM